MTYNETLLKLDEMLAKGELGILGKYVRHFPDMMLMRDVKKSDIVAFLDKIKSNKIFFRTGEFNSRVQDRYFAQNRANPKSKNNASILMYVQNIGYLSGIPLPMHICYDGTMEEFRKECQRDVEKLSELGFDVDYKNSLDYTGN
jgi:hypothetical protein